MLYFHKDMSRQIVLSVYKSFDINAYSYIFMDIMPVVL